MGRFCLTPNRLLQTFRVRHIQQQLANAVDLVVQIPLKRSDSSHRIGLNSVLLHRGHRPAVSKGKGLVKPFSSLSSLRRGFVSRLDCILLGHVFALPRRAIKTRAFPVVNTYLGIDPHLSMASARRGWVGRFVGRAPCGHRACSPTRFPFSLRFLGSGFCFGRSRWRRGGRRRCSFLSR